jgi:pSer/pThr/pTyr-binding forkhead associated (FHA) protein
MQRTEQLSTGLESFIEGICGSMAMSASGLVDVWALEEIPQGNSSVQYEMISNLPFRIGRHHENDLCLSDATVSARHAELVVRDGDLHLNDLSSTNGTYLNGERIDGSERLRAGDLLQFAAVTFTLVQHRSATSGAITSA